MEAKQPSLRVLMFPWLAHGHISPFLELAKKLSKRNFDVYLCSTPINLNSIKKFLSKTSSDLSINLVEFHLPSLPELPPHYHTTNGLPPHLMASLIQALEMATLVHSIPAVHFQTTGGTASAFLLRLFKYRNLQFPSEAILLREFEIKKLLSHGESTLNDAKEKDRVLDCIDLSSEFILVKSCNDIERKYIDFLSFLTKKKIIPVGSLAQDTFDDDETLKIMQWLNEKPQASSIFVSFGSECFLSKEEIEEIANGLDTSNVNFIWVIRFPSGKKTGVEKALPEGYLEKVKAKGLILEGWAPQAKILSHPSIGGFLSHCGWSSIMESISFGVPIIAMPMQLDQPLNARHVVEIGVAVEVIHDENGMPKAEEIARVVKEVVKENSGEDIRRRVRELSERIQLNSEEEINTVVEHLIQLCEKR
ncbi:hypothetical protein ACH5RR_033434 [Cinchona calisaya]|uniref:Glycosyltransferase n=1 Tax=Cinchona calisaya TaxID=153742 RepID=A0ABD2YQB7_9GENT